MADNSKFLRYPNHLLRFINPDKYILIRSVYDRFEGTCRMKWVQQPISIERFVLVVNKGPFVNYVSTLGDLFGQQNANQC